MGGDIQVSLLPGREVSWKPPWDLGKKSTDWKLWLWPSQVLWYKFMASKTPSGLWLSPFLRHTRCLYIAIVAAILAVGPIFSCWLNHPIYSCFTYQEIDSFILHPHGLQYFFQPHDDMLIPGTHRNCCSSALTCRSRPGQWLWNLALQPWRNEAATEWPMDVKPQVQVNHGKLTLSRSRHKGKASNQTHNSWGLTQMRQKRHREVQGVSYLGVFVIRMPFILDGIRRGVVHGPQSRKAVQCTAPFVLPKQMCERNNSGKGMAVFSSADAGSTERKPADPAKQDQPFGSIRRVSMFVFRWYGFIVCLKLKLGIHILFARCSDLGVIENIAILNTFDVIIPCHTHVKSLSIALQLVFRADTGLTHWILWIEFVWQALWLLIRTWGVGPMNWTCLNGFKLTIKTGRTFHINHPLPETVLLTFLFRLDLDALRYVNFLCEGGGFGCGDKAIFHGFGHCSTGKFGVFGPRSLFGQAFLNLIGLLLRPWHTHLPLPSSGDLVHQIYASGNGGLLKKASSFPTPAIVYQGIAPILRGCENGASTSCRSKQKAKVGSFFALFQANADLLVLWIPA